MDGHLRREQVAAAPRVRKPVLVIFRRQIVDVHLQISSCKLILAVGSANDGGCDEVLDYGSWGEVGGGGFWWGDEFGDCEGRGGGGGDAVGGVEVEGEANTKYPFEEVLVKWRKGFLFFVSCTLSSQKLHPHEKISPIRISVEAQHQREGVYWVCFGVPCFYCFALCMAILTIPLCFGLFGCSCFLIAEREGEREA